MWKYKIITNFIKKVRTHSMFVVVNIGYKKKDIKCYCDETGKIHFNTIKVNYDCSLKRQFLYNI